MTALICQQLLAELVTLQDDAKLRKSQRADGGRKAALERQVGAEIRNAAMRGMVDRNQLTDLAQLDDATVRERQGQRRRRSPSLSDKENADPATSRRGRKRRKLTDTEKLIEQLQRDNEQDQRRIELEDEKHAALTSKLDKLVDVLTAREAAQANQFGPRDVLQLVSVLGAANRGD